MRGAGDGGVAGDATVGVPALEIAGVSHRYGARLALDNVGFCVAPSSFTALLGLNGAGKSTLFSLITRLYGTQAGHIAIFGNDVRAHGSKALRLLGVVFQSRSLDPDLSVTSNLTYNAALHGIGSRDAKERAAAVLERVGMGDRAKDKVKALSGGQARRVEIARALLHRPKLLLLDEPTVGLDIKARADILRYVRGLLVEEGVGVLWATHLIDEIETSDDVVVLHKGKVAAAGSMERVLETAQANDLRTAFTRLTKTEAAEESERA